MDVNLIPLLPAAQVLLTALVVMVLDFFLKDREKSILAWISILGLGLGIAETLLLWGGRDGSFGETVLLDNFALFFTQISIVAAALTILSSIHYVRDLQIHEGEFYSLVLFATVGIILMTSANDLIVFFLGLETMSVAVYVLTGMWRASARSSEAAMKYFLMGAFATGFLLYGIALIYGATGSTHLNTISAYLMESPADWPL
jgi:NADH-quinone oxidoreductase subunit N